MSCTFYVPITNLRNTSCLFSQALRVYSVVFLPRASRFTLAFSVASPPLRLLALHSHSQSLCSLASRTRFWSLCFFKLRTCILIASLVLHAHKNFRKTKCVYIDSKCYETNRNAKRKLESVHRAQTPPQYMPYQNWTTFEK